jgi:integrase/recombinase XerC
MSAVLVAEDAPVDVPVLSARQQRELLRQPDKRTRLGKRDAALLAVLVGSGCRIGEAVRLRVQDIQPGPSGSLLLRLVTLKQRARKGSPLRPVALCPPFVSPVKKWLAGSAVHSPPAYWAFPGRHGDRLSVRAAQDAVMRHIMAVRPVGFRVHDIRHTCATDILVASGGDVWITAKMLGHVDTRQVVRTYAHYLTKDAYRTAEARALGLKRRGT